MAFQYPWGNLQGLNLTWFINQFKKLREDWATAEAGIDGALDAEIQRAEDAMSDVFTARDAAAASATAAGNSASTAASSATLANNKATAAGLSEAAAAQSASQAALSASNAGNAATQAGNSATAAGNSATAAAGSASAAAISETNAAASAQRAEDAAASAQTGAIVKSVENVPIASVDNALDEKTVELVVGIDPVQAGTGDPAPDNIRPITGWTGANVQRIGENILPFPYYDTSVTRLGVTFTVNNDGTILANGTATTDCTFELIRAYPYSKTELISGKNLRLQGCPSGGSESTYYLSSVITGNKDTGNGVILNNFNPAYFRFSIVIKSGFTANNLLFKPMITIGSTPTPYAQYQSTQHNVSFPDAAGPVYGGTLTNLGTNEWLLSINMLSIIFNDNTASFRAGTDGNPNAARIALSSDVYGSYQDRLKMISDQYNTVSITASVDKSMRLTGSSNTPYSEWIIIYDNRFTDEQTMRTILAANPVQIVYPLYQPIEYTITGDAIEMLLGINNIWADTGNINLLRYYADSKGYIDAQDALVKALIAKELDEMKADTALTANDFRIVNNTLYRITAPVANGATLTPGTNCTATTIAAILKTLLT